MNLSPKIQKKIETLKNIILTVGGFRSEYGSDVTIKLEQIDLDYNNDNDFQVHEIVLSINFKDVECNSCDFETEILSDMLFDMREKVRDVCNKFRVTKDLEFKKDGTSCRGVLNYGFKYAMDNFDYLEFGIFIDPGDGY